jgi:hypothetical protein
MKQHKYLLTFSLTLFKKMQIHCFRVNLTIKDYIIGLIKQDLNKREIK